MYFKMGLILETMIKNVFQKPVHGDEGMAK